MSVSFAYPYLLLLMIIPLFWGRLPSIHRSSDALSLALYVPEELLNSSASSSNWKVKFFAWLRFPDVFLWIAYMFLVVALAMPYRLLSQDTVQKQGRDLLLAIDISGSMNEDDFSLNGQKVSRIHAVKEVLKEFVALRVGDRMGLILFADRAFMQAPLSFDHQALKYFIDKAVIGLAGQKTAIGDALGLAVDRIKNLKDRQVKPILILLSDGVNNAGAMDPSKALALAQSQGLKVYTIAIGNEQPENFFSPGVDFTLLRNISEKSLGKFYLAQDADSLKHIYTEIDRLERVQSQSTEKKAQSLYAYPLMMALFLFLIWLYSNFIGQRRRFF